MLAGYHRAGYEEAERSMYERKNDVLLSNNAFTTTAAVLTVRWPVEGRPVARSPSISLGFGSVDLVVDGGGDGACGRVEFWGTKG